MFIRLVFNVDTPTFDFTRHFASGEPQAANRRVANFFSRNPFMRFTFLTLTMGLILTAPAVAGEDGLAGYWKLTLYPQGEQNPFWLVHLDKDKDNKMTASFDPLKGAPRAKIEDVKQDGDTIKIKFSVTITTEGGQRQVPCDYEGKLPKPGAKKIFGSLIFGKSTFPAVMEATAAKTIFEADREIVLRTPSDPRALVAILDLIDRAKDNKVDVKDLQTWVDGSLKAAAMYGPRFQMKHNISLLTALQGQKAYASVGVETARKASKLIDAKMPLDTQAQIMSLAAIALRGGGQTKEADTLDFRLDQLENQAYADFSTSKSALNFKTEKFPGRKAKSNRAVLVELFTGAQCPPCVASDMAFDGLEKTYQSGEVVLLQYHMHIPGPDPMSNTDSDLRFDFYADAYPKKVRGTPANLFNGKLEATGGGDRDDAPDKYKEFCNVVNKLLEAPDTLKLSASAVGTGSKIDIHAKVANLDKPGDKMRLRLVLVEDWVRYQGGNGLQYHHRVVRAMPGGAKGVPVKEKDFEHKANIDLDELRASLNKYLNEDYPEGPRPMRLRNLSVVAFVQNDESAEVLQAVNVPVRQEQ
jgi:hypothetical protein